MSQRPDPIVFEEHSSVLSEWRRREVKAQTLVYLDAHLDLQFVNEKRLERLRNASSDADFAACEKPDHLLPDSDFVFGLENFLFLASELGIIEHLIWVAPPHVEVSFSKRTLHYLQQMDGLKFDELSSIQRNEHGWYEGRLLGLRITFCELSHLKSMALAHGAMVDIDTDYFVALPEDRAWVDPGDVFAVLASAVPDPSLVTIARSVSSGFMPLRYRYFADYLASLWLEQPKAASHYGKLYQIEHQSSSANEAIEECRAELREFPDCPATHYLLERLENPGCRHSESAAELSEAYRDDPVRLASGVVNRFLQCDVSHLDSLYADFRNGDESDRPEGYIAFGLAYANCGAAQKALECYRIYGEPHPQLALSLSEVLERNDPLRGELLEVAASEDSAAASANLQLAELAMLSERMAEAEQHLERAHRIAPCWMAPLELLAGLHKMRRGASAENPYAIEYARRARSLASFLEDGERT